MLSVRTFSSSATCASPMVEIDAPPLCLPSLEPGPCQVSFSGPLLRALLRDLTPLETLRIEQFQTGLQVTGSGEGFSVFALLAGLAD
jgi:hypothetical protein